MSTLKQKVDYIAGIKTNLKTAIENKGGSVTEDFDSYATAIENLPSGGSCAAGVCFDSIGYDQSNDLNNVNEAIAYSKTKFDEWDPSRTSTANLYKEDKKLIYAPKIDTNKVHDMSYMFGVCTSLRNVPLLNTSSVTNMDSMFSRCSSLTSIPLIDTSSVTDMCSMFNNCKSLTTIPLLDTSSVTNMNSMFLSCDSLTTIPLIDTSSVTNMNSMFSSCDSLTTIPLIDAGTVQSMSYMFNYCKSLTTIPQLNTSSVTDMSNMFNHCISLTSIPLLDTSSVTNMDNIFGYEYLEKLTDMGGFKDLGKWGGFSNPGEFLNRTPNLTVDSLMNVINNLYDRKTAGYGVVKLGFGKTNLDKLSQDQIAIATNKGWTLV